MKYYLIVGEASGDLHASNLMRALRREDPEAEFRFFGGDLMAKVGGVCVRHYKSLAYMGFVPVLLHLRTILRNMDFCKNDVEAWNPDVLILVDYPGFNLKIAQYIKLHTQIPVFYYISPKIWAWKEYRIKNIKRDVDALFSILPFEVEFYRRHRYEVRYVGNPTVDELAERPYADETFDDFVQAFDLPSKPIIALLAGSRKAEIRRNLPLMLEAAERFSDYQCIVAGAPGIVPEEYAAYLQGGQARVIYGATYRLLAQSRAALVTSGTATLETALLRVPQVVCYAMPGGSLAYTLFKHWLKVRFVSLVNLIADAEVVKELLVHHCTAPNIGRELEKLLYDEDVRARMAAGYAEVARRLGAPGAPERAARDIVNRLQGGDR